MQAQNTACDEQVILAELDGLSGPTFAVLIEALSYEFALTAVRPAAKTSACMLAALPEARVRSGPPRMIRG